MSNYTWWQSNTYLIIICIGRILRKFHQMRKLIQATIFVCVLRMPVNDCCMLKFSSPLVCWKSLFLPQSIFLWRNKCPISIFPSTYFIFRLWLVIISTCHRLHSFSSFLHFSIHSLRSALICWQFITPSNIGNILLHSRYARTYSMRKNERNGL